MVQRHLLIRDDQFSGYRARHRVVADELVEAMEFRPYASTVLDGVCFAFANRVSPTMPRSSRPWRRLIRFMNHDFILRMTPPLEGRRIYTRLEQLLHWDYNYWLQRGCLEVEAGDLDLATNFLDQARSLTPDDKMVRTEYGYLLFRKATRNPRSPGAPQLAQDGFQLLEEVIRQHGKTTPYPYHVLGVQGLAWSKVGGLARLERRSFLRDILTLIEEGISNHVLHRDLKNLGEQVKHEWLATSLPDE